MAENVYEILKGTQPSLMEKLSTNEDLCTFLMLVYSHTLAVAAVDPKNPADIVLEVGITNERLMNIPLRYKENSGRSQVSLEGKIFSKRNPSLVRLLQVNQNLKDFPTRIVNVIERWIEEKPYRKECGFAHIRFENSMFWANRIFTSEMVLQPEFDYGVIKKFGWDKEPEQLTEEKGIIIEP